MVVGRNLTKAYGLIDRGRPSARSPPPDPAAAVAAAGGYLGAHDVNFDIGKRRDVRGDGAVRLG